MPNTKQFLFPNTQLPKIPGRWWEAIVVGIVIFTLAQLIATIFTLTVTNTPQNITEIDPVKVVLISLITLLTTFVLTVAYVSWRGKRWSLPSLGFRRWQDNTASPALLGGLISAVALETILWVLVPDQWLALHPFTQAVQNGTPIALSLVVLSGLVAAPLAEEALFRGYIFPAISQRFSYIIGALVSSLIFGLMHATSLTYVIFALLLGFVLAWVYKKSGSLWLSLSVHVTANALALIFALSGF